MSSATICAIGLLLVSCGFFGVAFALSIAFLRIASGILCSSTILLSHVSLSLICSIGSSCLNKSKAPASGGGTYRVVVSFKRPCLFTITAFSVVV